MTLASVLQASQSYCLIQWYKVYDKVCDVNHLLENVDSKIKNETSVTERSLSQELYSPFFPLGLSWLSSISAHELEFLGRS